jgi:hypothetical protein
VIVGVGVNDGVNDGVGVGVGVNEQEEQSPTTTLITSLR